MAAKYTIETTSFNDIPSGIQTCTVKYRKCADIDWTVVSNNVQVYPTGMLVSPLTIHNLLEATCYQVSVQNNCGSPAVVIEFTTPATPVVCPNVVGIGGVGALGNH